MKAAFELSIPSELHTNHLIQEQANQIKGFRNPSSIIPDFGHCVEATDCTENSRSEMIRLSELLLWVGLQLSLTVEQEAGARSLGFVPGLSFADSQQLSTNDNLIPPSSYNSLDTGPHLAQRHAKHGLQLTEALKHPVRRLLYLTDIVRASRKAEDLEKLSMDALVQLPDTSFSELLRSLDPIESFSKELDPLDDINVEPGMWQRTPLGNEIDVWGVRKRYVHLLSQALAACQMRLESGKHLVLSDYVTLLRCAGAACDLKAMQTIWAMMSATGYRDIDPNGIYELIRARFLTDPLYTQHDLARFLVRPINLHMQKLWILGTKQRQYLRILGHNRIKRQRHYFGHNRNSLDHAEPLARILRKHIPPFRLYKHAVRKCYIVEERVLCALMVAWARSGSLQSIQQLILKRYWGVDVRRRSGCQAQVTGQAIAYAPDSPLRPTTRLLEAIVTSYCLNSEFATALQVVDVVSRCYNIPITKKIWFALLEWAYILNTKPVAREWKIVGRQFRYSKSIHPNSVQMVWNTMTADPYNVRPGLYQYQLLAKSLVGQGRAAEALDIMLELEPMYRHILTKLELSFSKHAVSMALGIDVAKTQLTWRRARARKHAALYHMQKICRDLLKVVCRGRTAEHATVRGVPQFIEAFRDLLPANIKYPIKTGIIELHYAQPIRRLEWAKMKFVQRPATTGDVRIGGKKKKLKVKTIEETRLGPAPHLSLHGFLTAEKPSWVLVQREFH
ncbi:uncharacterized protein CTHT_0071720 [Thermochaetoides thermophila DSM 1495]|uniref:Pentatricopeptide repeat domain-containing protein n=1 Tax=Chaetomium thermophilum (strain DSM 1495 / CBS 144.50 / IMI 039719) TaxID=759272 RepID=G0SFQ4_CHATD|nr:hypothetical protein CTHT_0071720 [Thermochaetoides thermophila DSM 1495]EGS17819.1 hypothetical protein CTHT_0071720 [Thermochaetoides thermophila DSM 1495]